MLRYSYLMRRLYIDSTQVSLDPSIPVGCRYLSDHTSMAVCIDCHLLRRAGTSVVCKISLCSPISCLYLPSLAIRVAHCSTRLLTRTRSPTPQF